MADDWVVDSLVGFLQSPNWKSPIGTFLEQECIVFDEGGENEPVYKHVYSRYKTLAEKLMGTFMSELGVSTQQMAGACAKSKNLRAEHEKLFQSLLASGDYEVFKSVMTQKNIDLELQALLLLQKELGQSLSMYDSQTTTASPTPQQKLAKRDAEEEEALKGALTLSKRESELRLMTEDQEMEKLLELAIQESLQMYQTSQQDEQDEPASEKPTGAVNEGSDSGKDSGIRDVRSSGEAGTAEDESNTRLGVVPPLSSAGGAAVKREISGEQAAQLWIQNAKSELENRQSPEVKKHISKLPEELKAREGYLKSQRDRLLERKRKARAEELKCYKETAPKNPAPSRLYEEARKVQDDSGGAKEDSPVREDHIGQQLTPKSSSGVLCSVIARKLKEEQTS